MSSRGGAVSASVPGLEIETRALENHAIKAQINFSGFNPAFIQPQKPTRISSWAAASSRPRPFGRNSDKK